MAFSFITQENQPEVRPHRKCRNKCFTIRLTLHSVSCALYIKHLHDTYHYSDVIMSAMASQITGVSIVYSVVCSGADQRKHQSSVSPSFVRGIHQWPVNSLHKGPETRKMFTFDDVMDELPSQRDTNAELRCFLCFVFFSLKNLLNVELLWFREPKIICVMMRMERM